jgi:hypothetical protein
MNKFKLQQIGLALCGLCLSFFSGIWSHCTCITFFGEPEFPSEEE